MTRLRMLAPLLAAAVLAAVAVATVRDAGCDEPGYLAQVDGGYELVGGCIAAGDLLVADPPPPAPVVGEAADKG
ncbi:hypothetical protein [Pseudonocardia abyssalis]|uniref:Secreted protein n=1 Tax=Pseudonocardia abyssalis TaxID=2792008 RepID=A0ABS6UW86_9PSEU|nr:hypothetical protein [Pseudonocardia abyssalis]MBW0136535.1 hypothetical protein [Pseudonocardia abyssalis]